jgi:hypothetical protein
VTFLPSITGTLILVAVAGSIQSLRSNWVGSAPPLAIRHKFKSLSSAWLLRKFAARSSNDSYWLLRTFSSSQLDFLCQFSYPSVLWNRIFLSVRVSHNFPVL